jgi:hypothetical protein
LKEREGERAGGGGLEETGRLEMWAQGKAARLATLVLGCAVAASGFSTISVGALRARAVPQAGGRRRRALFMCAPQPVHVPADFEPPEPKPLTVTGDWVGMLTASVALALRCGAGLTVTGWKPELSLKAPDSGEYSLHLGPVYLSDTSAVTRGQCPRPAGKLVLYEFDSSPYCRKVRDACAHLDLDVDHRPCPGALPGGKFSDELFARTGRRTVPYLIDEGLGVEMFESDDIVNHLYAKYGPPTSNAPQLSTENKPAPQAPTETTSQSSVSRILSAPTAAEKIRLLVASTLEKMKTLSALVRGERGTPVYLETVPWQVRGVFAVVSAGLAATIRKIPAYKMQVDARPDNGDDGFMTVRSRSDHRQKRAISVPDNGGPCVQSTPVHK